MLCRKTVSVHSMPDVNPLTNNTLAAAWSERMKNETKCGHLSEFPLLHWLGLPLLTALPEQGREALGDQARPERTRD